MAELLEQMVKVTIPNDALAIIRINAQLAEIGGVSRIRPYPERQANLALDQLVGQVCEAAAVLYLTGSLTGYLEAREQRNADKYAGDQGRDVIGLPIDIKGSLMRSGGRPEDYRLIVRPRERHDKWVYALALVQSLDAPVTIHLCGWTRDGDLPPADGDGPFRDAHVIWADNLRPIQKLQQVVKRAWDRKRTDDQGACSSDRIPAALLGNICV